MVVQVVCCKCRTTWRVHNDLRGFGIRCRSCQNPIAIPPPDPEPEPAQRPALGHGRAPAQQSRLPSRAGGGRGLARRQQQTGERAAVSAARRGLLPVQDGHSGEGMLEDAPVAVRARWNSRAILDVFFVLAAIIIPQIVVYAASVGSDRVALSPIASVVGGLLVLLVALFSPAFAFGGLRQLAPKHCLEGIAVALGGAFVATGYMLVLHETMRLPESPLVEIVGEYGLPLTIFMIAVCPAIFEEIGFRGMVQGRLTAIYGGSLGGIYTATLFALAHGVTLALPIHFALGVYFGRLRSRSASLMPGIICHFVYNSSVVLLGLAS